MTKTLLCLAVGVVCITGCIAIHGGDDDTPACVQSCSAKRPQVLRHVVLFKFKDEATTEQVRAIENAFAALPSKVDLVRDFEWGTDVSVENLQDGFTHCFVVTFKSVEDRDRYLPHPAHEEFVGMLRPVLDKALVVDYWAKR